MGTFNFAARWELYVHDDYGSSRPGTKKPATAAFRHS